jgi:hypothetical protein
VRVVRAGFAPVDERVVIDADGPRAHSNALARASAAVAGACRGAGPGSLIVESRPAGAECSSTAPTSA